MSDPNTLPSHATAPSQRHHLLIQISMSFVVGIAVLATFLPVLSARGLSFDDGQYLIDNPLVRNPSWESTHRFLSEVTRPSTVQGYYQPLAMISLMLDCAMGGSAEDFRPFHRTSLALHAANTLLVMWLVQSLFGHIWASVVAGLLFGLHPMMVEAVATIGERKTVLSPFFALICLGLYVRYARQGGWGLYAASLIAYILALLSKPTSTPVALLLLLLDYWPLGRLNRNALIEKVPFVIIGVAFAVITVISQGQYAPVPMPGDYPWSRVPLILCHNNGFYLWKLVWPANLSVHYPYPEPLGLANPAVLGGVVFTSILLVVLFVSLKWTRSLVAGWTFFFLAILPTMGLVGFTVVLTTDKYVYLPMVGLLLIVAAGIVAVWRHWPDGSTSAGRLVRAGVVLIVLGLACGLGLATRRALAPWKDTVSLYRHMADLAPRALIVRNNLALALLDSGRTEEAIGEFQAALRVRPEYVLARQNLADALIKTGRVDEAIQHWREALRIDPNLAMVHYRLGSLLLGRNAVDEAMPHLAAAVQLRPSMAEAHNNLGVALLKSGRREDAAGHFREAVRLKPDFAAAQRNLSAATGQTPQP